MYSIGLERWIVIGIKIMNKENKICGMSNKIVNRETVLYSFFGVLTSIENILLFKLLLLLQIKYQTANFITLIIVKLTAYICNKNFVFQSKTPNTIELLKEFGRFVIARGATMLIDYFGLIFFVEALKLNVFYSKIFFTVLVIVINYFTGKKHVFKNRTN